MVVLKGLTKSFVHVKRTMKEKLHIAFKLFKFFGHCVFKGHRFKNIVLNFPFFTVWRLKLEQTPRHENCK